MEGQFFQASEAEAIFRKIGSPPEGADFIDVAGKLDRIAEDWVRGYRRQVAATAGKLCDWSRDAQSRVKDSLAIFGINGALDPPNSDAVNALLYEIPPDMGLGLNLRYALCEEIDTTKVPSEWHAIRLSFRAMQFLYHRLGLMVDELEKKKGAPRKPQVEEIDLVDALDQLYQEVTGERRAYTIDTANETVGGPLVEFVAEVAAHISKNLQVVPVDEKRDAGMAYRLKALSHSRQRIIRRIRQVRKLRPQGKSRTAPEV